MARTSRKGASRQAAAAPVERIWNVAVYARLSVEDSGRKGADTIETQIELVTSYVAQQSHLSLADTYIDNGESGKDFDRPAWSRLMDDIRSGRVDCVAVKDLSRFSRNYIETIEFLEKIFPFMGVRFISVNDGYDSELSKDSREGLIVALKSLVNDQYLKDISRKICSSIKAKRERGEYTGSQAPFGYKKVKGHSGKLEPDEETAPIVRQIFEWRAEGVSRLQICKRLDERGIPTPTGWLRQRNGKFNCDYFKASVWREATIKLMVRNAIYIGTLSQGKHEQRLYEHKPCTAVPKSDWCITENAHEPIISRELWEAANAVEAATRVAYANCGRRDDLHDNIFRGFIICEFCGTKIARIYDKKLNPDGKLYEYFHYKCPLFRQHHTEEPYRMIHEESLRDTVFTIVSQKLQTAANLGDIIAKRARQQANPRAAIDAEISRASRELEALNQRLAKLYENYVDRLLNEHEYVTVKAEYEQRGESLRRNIDELSVRAATIADVSVSDNRWLKVARDFQNPKELTREMLEAVVERIVVRNRANINVVFKFRDEFALLEVCAEEQEVR